MLRLRVAAHELFAPHAELARHVVQIGPVVAGLQSDDPGRRPVAPPR